MKQIFWDSAEIDPWTGQPYAWDSPNPNVTWDGVLEEGDSGFVPYPVATPSVTTKSKRKKNMPKSDYLKSKDAEFSAQHTTFKLNIGNYAATFGLTAAQITTQANDAIYFAYILSCQDVCSQGSQQWTAWKDLIRGGGSPPASGMPMPGVFPPVVPAVDPGIEVRFRALVKIIKAHPAYNTGIGEALGIEGPAHTGPDFIIFRPELELVLQGGLVFILWTWLGQRAFLDMIEILVDRADGKGFVFLTNDTTPGYLDTTPLPASAAKWTYKAIFRVGDQRVGQWSNEVSIIVGA